MKRTYAGKLLLRLRFEDLQLEFNLVSFWIWFGHGRRRVTTPARTFPAELLL